MFEVNHEKGLVLSEIADDLSVEDIKAATGCGFQVHLSAVCTGCKHANPLHVHHKPVCFHLHLTTQGYHQGVVL